MYWFRQVCMCFNAGPPRQMADWSPAYLAEKQKNHNILRKNAIFNEHPVPPPVFLFG